MPYSTGISAHALTSNRDSMRKCVLWVCFKNHAHLHISGNLQVQMLQLKYSTKMIHLQVWQTFEMLYEYIEFFHLHDNHKNLPYL